MKNPLISVVMPVFNREAFLGEAVESVLAQTYTHWELIIVDDGSQDGSAAIAQTYVTAHPEKIRYISHPGKENKGISASRNLGGRQSKGEYIACLDSDDIWVPGKLESQVRILKEEPEVGLIVGATKYWYPDKPQQDRIYLAGGPRDRLIDPPFLFEAMYPIGTGTAPSMNTVLLRRDVFDRIGGWEEQFRTTYEDQAMLCKVYLSEKVYISSEVWDIYRQHPTSIMSTELSGIGYFRKRYVFLLWLERWFRDKRPHLRDEHLMVRRALRDRRLWFARGPVRHSLWRSYRQVRSALGRVNKRARRLLKSTLRGSPK